MSRLNDYSPSSSWTTTRNRYIPGNSYRSPDDGQFGWDYRSAFQNTENGTPAVDYRSEQRVPLRPAGVTSRRLQNRSDRPVTDCRHFEERVPLRPFRATSSIPMETYTRTTRIIFFGNHPDHGMNPRLPPFVHQFTRRPIPQRNTHVPPSETDESKLTKQEQEIVLNNLHRQTYNQGKLATKVSLYYRNPNRDPNSKASEKNKDEDGKNCAVCLEDFECGEEVMVTPCKHMFHEECIVPWVKNHGKCPVCRSALCDSIKQNEFGSNRDNRDAVLPADPGLFSSEILSLLRAVDEAFVLGA